MKKILIPTDFSDNAWDALTYAIRLYDDIPCLFYVVNTYELVATGVNTTVHSGATKKLLTILKDDSKKGLEKIEKHLNEYLLNDKHEYKIISKHGSITSVVQDLIDKMHIDLVVMGTTGASGMKKVLMGSNTVKLIQNIKGCPVIAVPKAYEFREPEIISFASDLKKLFSHQDLRPLHELLLLHDLDLELLHVKKERLLSEVQQQNIATIKDVLGEKNVNYKEIPLDISVANSINTYLTTNTIDIVCLAKYEHNFWERLTREPVIKKVGFHVEIPLLIIPI